VFSVLKIEELKGQLGSVEHYGLPEMTRRMVLPHLPMYRMDSLLPEEATIFKSAQMPLKLSFQYGETEEGAIEGKMRKGAMIFKVGDNLHQDQVILQVIRLMTEKLERSMIDCKILSYSVLATGSDHGILCLAVL
jgi:phosphatidylinositol 3-kinase